MKRTALPIVFLAALVASACSAPTMGEDLTQLPRQSNQGRDWRDEVIYQIVVDRWSNGDPNNDFNVIPSSPGAYHGGDWQGVIDKLDYLEELGVTALWISPVVKNTEEDAGFYSYHGYWTQDFLRTNPHFGDLLKMRELVDEAHARGMLVVLDIVTNHVGQLFYYDINGNANPDEWMSGGGTSHTCVQICNNPGRASECSADEQRYCELGSEFFERILEWDPEYDPRGIQGWTSGGFNGPADIRFPYWPELNRTAPPRPPEWMGWPRDRAWFDDASFYNRRGRVYVWWQESNFSREFVREQEVYGDFPGGLKDLDTDNPEVIEAMIMVFQYWMDVGDFDGFRIDTLKHIDRPDLDFNDRGFFGEFTNRIRAHAKAVGKQNFFMFGEAFDGNDVLLGQYTFPGRDERGDFGRVDSVFYFSHKYRIFDNVIKQSGNTKDIECMYYTRVGADPGPDTDYCRSRGFDAGPLYYDQPHAAPEDGGIGLSPQETLVTFMDNHDVPRFLFENDNVASLWNAMFYMFTFDGIPAVYYGTEQEFEGGTDPKNREDMFRGNPIKGYPAFDTTNRTFRRTKELIQMRKDNIALRRGAVRMIHSTEAPAGGLDHGVFAFEREAPEQKVLVVMNVADGQESRTCGAPGECMQTTFSAGTVLTNVAPGPTLGETYTVGAGGELDITIAPRDGLVLVP